MSAKALTLLEAAKALLKGGTLQVIAKADPATDGINPDVQSNAVSPTQEDIDAAKKEAQSGQQAQGEPGQPGEPGQEGGGEGAPGHPEPDGDEGKPGPGDNDGDEGEVTKAEILQSMRFLCKSRGITGAEIAKAFSGLEGYPVESPMPVGKGEELLERIVTGQKGQEKILELIAESIAEFTRLAVGQKEELAKAHQEVSLAQQTANDALARLDSMHKTAPAMPAKAMTNELAKGFPGVPQSPAMNCEDLTNLILSGKMTNPVEIAKANKAINYAPR